MLKKMKRALRRPGFENPQRTPLASNAAPIRKKTAPKHLPLTKAQRAVAFCHHALLFAGKMVYTQDLTLRQQLFGRKPADFAGAHADCSQFVSTILHWLGVKAVNARDFTGTLWNKGKVLAKPQPACVVIFGAYPGEHTGFVTEKTPDGKDWYVVGFGWGGAPDRSTLTGMESYFAEKGHPGVRFLDFLGE